VSKPYRHQQSPDIARLLIVAIPLAYLPQYTPIIALRSSNGISLPASCLLALAAQTQLVSMYYIFVCHPETRYGDIIGASPSPQNWLDLVQIVVQWACSLIQYVFHKLRDISRVLQIARLTLVVAFESSSENIPSREPAETPESKMSGRTAVLIILLHAAVSATFAIIAGKPQRQLGNLAFLIIMSANNYIAIPLSTLATLAAFACQIRHNNGESTSPRGNSPNALSTRVLALQVALFLALALFWPSRLRLPRNLRGGDWWVVTEWYPQVGWACVNNGIIAAGSIFVLFFRSSAGSDGGERVLGERRVLLG
jgi:hypothetical protein